MTDFRILCTSIERPTMHKHIVRVGVGTDPDRPSHHWTIDEMRESMGRGDRFYTFFRGETALVEPFTCACGYQTVRSAGDDTARGLVRVPQCVHIRVE